jgi:HlyD family secretion protein
MAEVKAAEEALQTLQAEQQDPDYLQNVYRAQIAGAQAELANLADQAQRTDISAPAAGQVLQLNQQSARYVQAGDPLVEVGNPGASELVIDVLSTDAEQVQPGDPVKRAGADPPVATVRLVEPSAFTKVSALGVEEQRVNVIADWLTLPTGLGDGYRVDTEIVIWSAEAVVKVPVSALFRCQQAWCVFVDQHGRAAQQAVQVNQRNAFEAVVEAGLQVGDRVVLYPPDNLSDRQRISER